VCVHFGSRTKTSAVDTSSLDLQVGFCPSHRVFVTSTSVRSKCLNPHQRPVQQVPEAPSLLLGRTCRRIVRQGDLDDRTDRLLVSPALLEVPRYAHSEWYRVKLPWREQSQSRFPDRIFREWQGSPRLGCPHRFTHPLVLLRELLALGPSGVETGVGGRIGCHRRWPLPAGVEAAQAAAHPQSWLLGQVQTGRR
jgi:hypothetical protein